MRVLSSEQCKNVKAYKYCGEDHSVLTKYILGPYWNWLVTKFPLWMAPNLITVIGFVIMVFHLALVLYYSPDLATPCPGWVYISSGIGLFVYQSLDSIDGKQARRTGTSSPLGELFDHGCDAMNTIVSTVIGASALNLKQSWLLTISVISTVANFYLSSWEEYHTKVLYLSFISGPVEGILSAVAALIVAGVFGPEFFNQTVQDLIPGLLPVGVQPLPLNLVLVAFGMFVCGLNIILAGINVCRKARSRNEGPIVPFLRLQLLAVWTIALITWVHSSPAVRIHAQIPLILTMGLAFGHFVGQVILAHLTASPFPEQSTITILLIWLGLIPTIILQGASLSLKGVFHVVPSVYPLFSKLVLPVLGAVSITPAAVGEFIAKFLNHWKFASDHVWLVLEWVKLAPSLPSAVGQVLHPSFNAEIFKMQVTLIYFLLVIAFVWYAVSAVCVINELCAVFDIYCFSIKHPVTSSGKPANQDARESKKKK